MDDEVGLIHPHCVSCFSINCTGGSHQTCPVIACPNLCGSKFHRCKQTEHAELCKNMKQPCINAGNGCPFLIPRWKHGSHLRTCPASVIRCSYQWNRWPMHSAELRSKAQLPLNNPYVKCSQLDAALGLRDQRMLLSSFKVPKTTRRALRNVFTPKYPAVPIDKSLEIIDDGTDMSTSIDSLHNEDSSDEDEFAPWNNYRYPPGLERSMVHKLQKSSAALTRNVGARDGTRNGLKNEFNIRCRLCNRKNTVAREGNSLVGINEVGSSYGEAGTVDEDEACDKGGFNDGHRGSDLINDDFRSVYDDYNHGIKREVTRKYEAGNGVGNPPDTCCCNISGYSSNHPDGEILADIRRESDALRGAKKLLEKPLQLKVNQILGVDLNVEAISWLQVKPESMYTFLCGQDFRRDEYDAHVRNVHGDIQPALNHWIEQRCPLAYYGCPFTSLRLEPSTNHVKSVVTHSGLLESFGVRVKDESVDGVDEDDVRVESGAHEANVAENVGEREATPEIIVSHKFDSVITIKPYFGNVSSRDGFLTNRINIVEYLPYVIWCKILDYLDGFSLNNLSLVNKELREICLGHVLHRGIVIQTWQRKEKLNDRARRWTVSGKKWKFSTSFSPVLRWKFVSPGAISEHLKVCKYNADKIVYTSRVKLLEREDKQLTRSQTSN